MRSTPGIDASLPPMAAFALDGLAEAANLDEEFRVAARLWSATLRLEAEGDALAQRIEIEDGRVTEAGPAGEPTGVPGEVRIAAPAEDWSEFLAPVPRPFYQDLWGALTHHGFRVEGDLERLWPWYPAAQRLFQLLRER